MTASIDRPADSWRLPAHHAQDLRDVARGVEETNAGVCTRYLLDELERGGPPADGDVALFEAESFVDQYVMRALELERLFGEVVVNWRAKMKRCRRALTLLSERGQGDFVGILHVAYGYLDPFARSMPKTAFDFFGPELAPLVKYTDATEAIRREMVRAGVHAQRQLARSWVTTFALRKCEAYEPPSPDVVDLVKHRAVEAYLDRVISSGDALREVLDPVDPQPAKRPDEAKDAYELRIAPWAERRRAYDARRTTFLVEARAEADRLLTRASRAYQEAWRASK